MFDKEQINESKKSCKIVHNAWDARNLLKMGHTIVDIKPKKGFKKQTVFVFAIDETLMEDLEKLESTEKEEE